LLAARAQRRAWPLDGTLARQLLRDSARPFATASVVDCGNGVLDVHAALRALDASLDAQLQDQDDTQNTPFPVPASSTPVAA
jgi:hypothetical protein